MVPGKQRHMKEDSSPLILASCPIILTLYAIVLIKFRLSPSYFGPPQVDKPQIEKSHKKGSCKQRGRYRFDRRRKKLVFFERHTPTFWPTLGSIFGYPSRSSAKYCTAPPFLKVTNYSLRFLRQYFRRGGQFLGHDPRKPKTYFSEGRSNNYKIFFNTCKEILDKKCGLIVLFLKAAGNGVTYINLRVLSF